MLGKLFKHEWRSFSPAPTITLIIMAIFTTIIMCSFMTRIWEDEDNVFLVLFAGMIIMAYFFCLMAVAISIALCTAVRFYKNLFTDEGYLMFTLPVKPSQLLLSKGLVAFLWQIIASAAVALSVFCLISVMVINIGELEFFEFFEELGDMLKEAYDLILHGLNVPVFLVIIWIILIGIASAVSNILFIYTCICLGQLFSKHKIGGAILCYFGLRFALQSVERIFTYPLTELLESITDGISTGLSLLLMFFSLVLMCGLCVGMYYVCLHLMTKKLNLD